MTTPQRPSRLPLPPEVRAAVKAGAAHKRRYGRLTREQEDKMVRAYGAALKVRRKPGRKPDPTTTMVAAWRLEGVRWSEVYKRLGYNELRGWERTCRKDSLRRNLTAYMKRNGMIPPHPIRSRS